ncbi:TonB-dependent receptor [Pedobacter sp. HMWF019]|uniref:TonB-dependent receptor n=1 Tax=Pedobacter sp. HMWF019 TaxID=2056856 RepID=UPI001304A82F|nr:TonB-dependent receptor [Pedobacter sp. HMWF019]
MKLTVILLLFFNFSLKAKVYSQGISISERNAPIEKVFKQIIKLRSYEIVYDIDVLKNARPVSLSLKNASIKQVLDECFSGQPFTYIIIDKTIIVKPWQSSRLEITVNGALRGKITDAKTGTPIPGVVLSLVKENVSKKQFSTDTNGSYIISSVAPGVYKLTASYVGFTSQTKDVTITEGKTAELNFAMAEELNQLSDVVVVGYGTQNKKDLTGAITHISSDDYKDQPVLNASSALQGRVAGAVVTNSSGAPGGQVKIRIRGGNSVNASNDPLYVVDGIALTSIGLQEINVNDIESMEILKDASATAVYGSRGANGVVIVTTKTGKSGIVKVDYNSFIGFNKPMKQYDLMDAVTYGKLANLIAGGTVVKNPESYAGKTTDWQKMIFSNAITQSHQLSVSGGTEKSKYYISGYYTDQQGLLVNSSQKKFSLRSNLDTKITEKISLGLNIFAERINSHNNGDIGSKGNAVMGALTWAPTAPVFTDADGLLYNRTAISPIWTNPYMNIKEADNDIFNNVAIFNGKAKYLITDWLSLTVNAGLDLSNARTAFLRNNWITPGNMGSGQAASENYTFQNSNVLTFHKLFAQKHDLTATLLAENTSSTYNNFAANGSGLTTTSNSYYNLGLNGSQNISSGYTNSSLLSFMGRVAYSYGGKYLLTASVRRDGSSKFSDGNKWGTFPSLSLGWKLSEESFIKDLNLFSDLKLRGSWGKTGNQGIAPYSTLGLMTPAQYSYGSLTTYQGYVLGNPQTPNVKWETTNQTDLGLDASFFGNRLNLTADFYNKNTTGLLLFTQISNYDGGGSLLKNIGEVNNKGFELMIDATPVKTANFSWSTRLNGSINHNKVISLGGDDIIFRDKIGGGLINTNIQAVKVGEPLGSFYLIPWNGVYSTDDPSMGFKAGDNKYTDVSGNHSIGYEDRVIAGSATPTFQWGFNNNFVYKNFELNIFIQGSHGNKVFNATYAATAVPTSDVAYPTLAAAANYWTPQNTGSVWANPISTTGRRYVESTQFLQDGGYIRVKNISLSYSLSKTLLHSLRNAKFTVSAQNYLTFTKYKGYDPEATSTSSSSDADGGIDMGAYPSAKTITLGLNVGF